MSTSDGSDFVETRPFATHRVTRAFQGNLIVTLAGITLAASTTESSDWESPGLILALGAFAVASELVAYGPPRHWVVSTAAPYVLAITLLGPAPAAVIALVALTAAAVKERSRLQDVVANFASYATFSVLGGLLSEDLVERFDLTPSALEFGALVLVMYGFVTVLSLGTAITYERAIRAPRRNRVAVAGQAIVECPTAFITAATALVYGRVGIWGLSTLVVAQVLYSYLFLQLARSEERESELLKNRAERGKLIDDVARARERERVRLAAALHDESLQNLYALKQEVAALPDAASRTRAGAAVDRTIAQLRGELLDLNPTVLASAGLGEATRALANAISEWAGFTTQVHIDPAATGIHDHLLFELVRELLMNSARHAQASSVEISICHSGNAIAMSVTDDGKGMPGDRRRVALTEGHVGLPLCQERVMALGGSFAVQSAPGRGTVVMVHLPAGNDRAAAASGEQLEPVA